MGHPLSVNLAKMLHGRPDNGLPSLYPTVDERSSFIHGISDLSLIKKAYKCQDSVNDNKRC